MWNLVLYDVRLNIIIMKSSARGWWLFKVESRTCSVRSRCDVTCNDVIYQVIRVVHPSIAVTAVVVSASRGRRRLKTFLPANSTSRKIIQSPMQSGKRLRDISVSRKCLAGSLCSLVYTKDKANQRLSAAASQNEAVYKIGSQNTINTEINAKAIREQQKA